MAKSSKIRIIDDPVDDQMIVKTYDNPGRDVSVRDEDIPEVGDSEALLTLESESGVEGYMVVDQARQNEYVESGISSVEALEKLCRDDGLVAWSGQPENFEPDNPGYDNDYDPSNVWSIATPSHEEIDGFVEEQGYSEALENAETDEEERRVLEDIWEEAADFEPEAKEKFG